MSDLESLIPVVIVGHVDHGKSTFIGRLLNDTGLLTPDRLKDLQDAGEALHRQVEYAHVTDQFQEEREANITIDTTETRFPWKERLFMLIDAPGHKEYLANMITGAARARHAILMLDVNEGIRAQTEKHADILKLLGVSHLAVLVNKMDLVDYKQDVFDRLSGLISESLGSRGLKAAAIIPLAAYHGENVARRSDKMTWYQGPTALEFLESCRTDEEKSAARPVFLPIQMMHDVKGSKIALGRIEEGTLRSGQSLSVFPAGQTIQVKRIRIHDKADLTTAGSGMSVGIEVDQPQFLNRGFVLCESSFVAQPPQSFSADVFWASTNPLKPGDECDLECRTQTVRCRITAMNDEESHSALSQLEHGGLARVQAKLLGPVLIRPHIESDVFGRIVFNRNGETVGCGVVAQLD